MRNLFLLLLFLALAGCSQEGWNDRLASPAEQRLALRVAEQLRQGQTGSIIARARPELKAAVPRAVAQVAPMLKRAEGPFTIETVAVFQEMGGPTLNSFNLQSGSGNRWALTEIVLQDPAGSWQIAGFRVFPAAFEPAKLNDFDINRRGLLGYVWITMMLASVATCLAAIVLIWRSRWLNRRWLWTVGSLFGFVGFALNWTTGASAVQFINVSLLGAGAIRAGPFAPWVFSFGIPIIAILVIVRWFRRERSQAQVGDAFH